MNNSNLSQQALYGQAVFSSSLDGMIVINDRGIILELNPSAQSIFMYPRTQIIGQDFSLLFRGNSPMSLFKQDTLCEGIAFKSDESEVIVEFYFMKIDQGFISCIRDITERKKAEEAMKYLAYHDSLTGLYNRLKFREYLHAKIEQQNQFALLYIDLNHFKKINDQLGHLAGDTVLQKFAERVSGNLSVDSLFFRIAGDEFTIVLDCDSPELPTQLRDIIISDLEHPFLLYGQEVYISASIGFSIFPYDGDTPDKLLDRADSAMYHIKKDGGK